MFHQDLFGLISNITGEPVDHYDARRLASTCRNPEDRAKGFAVFAMLELGVENRWSAQAVEEPWK